MIRITQDTANSVVVTLTEKGTASWYLFEFQNLTTLGKSYCVAEDTSAFQDRYNAFTITDQASPTPADAEVNLEQGEHRYVIYANSSSSNVDPTGLTELESGMCIVTGTTTNPTEYSNNPNYVVYGG